MPLRSLLIGLLGVSRYATAAPSGSGLNYYAGHVDSTIHPAVATYSGNYPHQNYYSGNQAHVHEHELPQDYIEAPYNDDEYNAKYPVEPYAFQQEELDKHGEDGRQIRKGRSRKTYSLPYSDAPPDPPVLKTYATVFSPLAAGGQPAPNFPPSFGSNPAPFVPEDEELSVEDELVNDFFTPPSDKVSHGIEGGIGAAVVGSAAYGAKKIYKHRKNKQEERARTQSGYEMVESSPCTCSHDDEEDESVGHMVKRSNIQPFNADIPQYSTQAIPILYSGSNIDSLSNHKEAAWSDEHFNEESQAQPWDSNEFEGYSFTGPDEDSVDAYPSEGGLLDKVEGGMLDAAKKKGRKLLYQLTPSAIYAPPPPRIPTIQESAGYDDPHLGVSPQTISSKTTEKGPNWGRDAVLVAGGAVIGATGGYGIYRAAKEVKKRNKKQGVASSSGDVALSKRSNYANDYSLTPSHDTYDSSSSSYVNMPDYGQLSGIYHPHQGELSQEDMAEYYDENKFLPTPPFESYDAIDYDGDDFHGENVSEETYQLKLKLKEKKKSRKTSRRLLQGVSGPAPFDPNQTPLVGGFGTPVYPSPDGNAAMGPPIEGQVQTPPSDTSSLPFNEPPPAIGHMRGVVPVSDPGADDLKKALLCGTGIVGTAAVLGVGGCIYCKMCRKKHAPTQSACEVAVPRRAPMGTGTIEMQQEGQRMPPQGRGRGRGSNQSIPPRPMPLSDMRLGPMPPEGMMAPPQGRMRGPPPSDYYHQKRDSIIDTDATSSNRKDLFAEETNLRKRYV